MSKREIDNARHTRDRYSRQTMFPAIGEQGQHKLGNSFAVIIGCGALGCSIATLLVRAGVGRVRIIDRDFIEYHNLQRQVLFDEKDVKDRLPKAIAAERHLKKVNSTVTIEGVVADINSANIEKLCRGADILLDGLDNLEARFLINDFSLKYKIPWIYGGAIASDGMTMTIIPDETPCLRCISPVLPDRETVPTCETAGVINAAPVIIASLQATDAIRMLVGSANITGKLTIVDVWNRMFNALAVHRREDCPACHGIYEYLDHKFQWKISPLCGQSRAVQIVNATVGAIDLDKLAARLAQFGDAAKNDFMLTAIIGKHEIIVFPDGRAIIKNTLDEKIAKELYLKYIIDQSK
jgi:molybdopterin/thiamine biosynthesis adenylyltransferase